MADFTLDGTITGTQSLTGLARASIKSSGDVTGTQSVTGGVWPSIVGVVSGQGDGINNVRGRLIADIHVAGSVLGVGTVTGYVTRTITGLVSGVGAVTGSVSNTPRVFGEVLGLSDVTGYPAGGPKVAGLVSGASSLLGGAYPAVFGEVAGVGVLTGDSDPNYVVAGNVEGIGLVLGFASWSPKLDGTVLGTQSLTGFIGTSSKVTGTVLGIASVTGVLRIAAKITNRNVFGNGEVTGALVRERTAAASAEGNYESTGIRRAFGLLVYELNAFGLGSLGEVPDGGNFLVAASYIGTPGDPFYEAGAAPNAIGTKVQPLFGAAYYVFRQPLTNETVWYVQGEQTYRFQEDLDTGVSSWVKYRTMPHRAADGMRLFDIFDPDGIYKYFAKVLGFVQTEMAYDNAVLLDQYDPDLASRFYLPELASNYGLTLDFQDDLPVRRAKTRNAVSTYKQKGLDSGIRLRIRSLGYTGYANEIWVNPTDPGNYQSPVLNDNGSPSSSETGAGTAYREYPHGYRADDPEVTADGYYPSSRIAVHLNDGSGLPMAIDDTIKERVARELGIDVLPAFVDIRYFVTDVPVVEPEGVEVDDDLEITEV